MDRTDFDKLRKKLAHLTDRELVIVSNADLENIIQKMLEARLIDFNQKQQSGFAHNVRLAYSAGLIIGDVKDVLLNLAKLRNYFAHSAEASSLEDAEAVKYLNAVIPLFKGFFADLAKGVTLPPEVSSGPLYRTLPNRLKAEVIYICLIKDLTNTISKITRLAIDKAMYS
ncbi:hypothetical protein LJB99_02855 [Deltaproteobacteria bacterium OttesenSCG-928-K17]|nr:hypothetical protein [Deltaproteobacteria bacterium OttesenSCG-928-K17]